MAEQGHRRFEELALGHVLGGLPSREASLFRAHLVECRDCRRRVAELRDIADVLEATEREERRRAAVATQVADREDEEEPTTSRPRVPWPLVAIVLGAFLVGGVLFWNYHLRRVTSEYAATLDRQEAVLDVLSVGEPVSVTTSEGVDATAAIQDGTLAVSLHDVPEIESGFFVAIWRGDGDEFSVADVGPAPDGGPLPFTVETRGSDTVLVTVEKAGESRPDSPGNRELARIALDRGATPVQ